jgi:hypothetical protein
VRRRSGVVSFAIAAGLASTQLAGSCVDGVTPDCSDAAVCAPNQGDASGGSDVGVVVPEASIDAETEAATDAEAGLDADADGG